MVTVGRGVVLAICLLAATALAEAQIGRTTLKFNAAAELRDHLLATKAELSQFRQRGPFGVILRKDVEIRLPTRENFKSDIYLAEIKAGEKAPLVVLLHGYGNTKETHALQAMHLASWGMHCLVVQLPNRQAGWITNGRTLGRLVTHVQRRPDTLDTGIDASKIILAGHSFGGGSVAIALAERIPAVGGILLDPAVVIANFPATLRRISKPVVLIGADESVSAAINRGYFYRYIPRAFAEVSIRGAAHEDAQFPADYEYYAGEGQLAFVSALTSAAFSLSSTGKIDYAWASFGDAVSGGKLFNPRRK